MPNIFLFASTYIVPALTAACVVAPGSQPLLYPLALLVFLYGAFETFLRTDLVPLERVLSVAAHVVPCVVCCFPQRPPMRVEAVLLAVGALLCLLLLFCLLGHWPYVVSKPWSMVLVAALALACLGAPAAA